MILALGLRPALGWRLRAMERIAVEGKRLGRKARAMLREEEQLLASVRAAVERAPRRHDAADYDRELLLLRDAIAEERLPDDQAMILEQMDRLEALSDALGYEPRGTVDPASPYFAHLRLSVEGESDRDIFLGRRTFVREGVRIVDWRDAPISRVFYRYREGDAFVEEIAGRQIEGQVKVRRLTTVVDGRLVRVSAPAGTFLCTSDGWRDITAEARLLEGGGGRAVRPDTAPLLAPAEGRLLRADKHLQEIAAELDPEQYDLLTHDGEGLLVVAGGAGSGKTTVGLHRLAYLSYADPERFRPRRMLALLFSRALSRYIARVLPALGVQNVPVLTLGEWSQAFRRRHFPELGFGLSASTPAVVVRFKTHRLLVPALDAAAKARPGADPATLFDELFTDRGWLSESVRQFAPGAFSPAEIEAVHRWCADAMFRRIDGRSGEDDEPPSLDEEDNMILLRLYQLLRGPLRYSGKRRVSYDHILVDEVQDFSPLELLVLRETARGASMTLAGDPAQRVTDNDFAGFGELLGLLGQPDAEVVPLRVSYRSTQQIMAFANSVLGPLAPAEPLQAERTGAPVELIRCGGPGPAVAFLGDALGDLARREPNASVAVLTRTAEEASQAFEALRRTELPGLQRVADQNFSFGPGVEVTDVTQAKGLEFDYVVLFGVDLESYPETPISRHLLHVGATRAVHQLWLVTWGRPSPLLPAGLQVHLGG